MWKTQFVGKTESGTIVTSKDNAGLGINFLDNTRKSSSRKDGAAESDANTLNSVPGRKVEKCQLNHTPGPWPNHVNTQRRNSRNYGIGRKRRNHEFAGGDSVIWRMVGGASGSDQ